MVPSMDRIMLTVAGTPITLEMLVVAGAAVFALLLLALVVMNIRQARMRAAEAQARQLEAEAAARRSAEFEKQVTGLLHSQHEMNGRMQTMAEIFGTRTSDLARLVNDR